MYVQKRKQRQGKNNSRPIIFSPVLLTTARQYTFCKIVRKNIYKFQSYPKLKRHVHKVKAVYIFKNHLSRDGNYWIINSKVTSSLHG